MIEEIILFGFVVFFLAIVALSAFSDSIKLWHFLVALLVGAIPSTLAAFGLWEAACGVVLGAVILYFIVAFIYKHR